eukprot:scaffold7353_cov143-Isochrysis_galbana.AAC.1
MAFEVEGYNQLIKSLATMSNFKSPLVSIATFWISKTARDLVANRSASFSAGAICIDWETTDLQQAGPFKIAAPQLLLGWRLPVESKVVHEVNKRRRDEPAACMVANISLTTG